ncbi:FxLYD domain-containing protein [Haloarcula onubensis]|uniref:FxLYD domain-containing protein n=1 Tax=Haloarcula onubensis TaxID=2950539 RepID=A0ABU2FQY9_9EURY|nr:FxLYD domain-containing protein [Halomicroarcula sp. S3CR25-11]MDS0283180.1 FxLYD domain-containing protein [Halomicroarcula sp. S3CR25-11]
MVTRREIITATGSLGATLALAGCSNNGNDGGTETGATTETGTGASVEQRFDPINLQGSEAESLGAGVNLISHSAYETAENVGVTGVIENTAEQAYSQVTVTVALQDGDEQVGEFVDRSETDLDRLEPGLQWRFWTTFDDEQLTDSMNYVIDVAVETTGEGTATAGSETGAVGGPSTATASEPGTATGTVN